MNLTIAESIHGTFYYHLSPDNGRTSLCGAPVMTTAVPLVAWGTKTHLDERYCKKCEALKAQGGE